MFFHSHFSQLDLKVPVFSVSVICFDCLLMYFYITFYEHNISILEATQTELILFCKAWFENWLEQLHEQQQLN